MQTLGQRIDRLIVASDSGTADTSPFQRVSFVQRLDPDRWPLPEPMISLYHHPVYATLSDAQRWRLALLEAVNFFSINIHGERALVTGLVQRLFRNSAHWDSTAASRYLQRFIHEENSHSYMMAEYCVRYGGRVLPDATFSRARPPSSATLADLLFFGRTFVLENFLAFLNSQAMRDPDVDPCTRAVHRVHHGDEARHLAFDRAVLTTITEQLRAEQGSEALTTVGAQLNQYAQLSLRRLYSGSLYAQIGLENSVQLAQEARHQPGRQALEQRWLEGTLALLRKLQLLPNVAQTERECAVSA